MGNLCSSSAHKSFRRGEGTSPDNRVSFSSLLPSHSTPPVQPSPDQCCLPLGRGVAHWIEQTLCISVTSHIPAWITHTPMAAGFLHVHSFASLSTRDTKLSIKLGHVRCSVKQLSLPKPGFFYPSPSLKSVLPCNNDDVHIYKCILWRFFLWDIEGLPSDWHLILSTGRYFLPHLTHSSFSSAVCEKATPF